jgi:hypothetical protein
MIWSASRPAAAVSLLFANHNGVYSALWAAHITNAAANLTVASLRKRGRVLIEMCSVSWLPVGADFTGLLNALPAYGEDNLSAIANEPYSKVDLMTAPPPGQPGAAFTTRGVAVVFKLRSWIDHLQKSEAVQLASGLDQTTATGVKLKKRMLLAPRLQQAKLGFLPTCADFLGWGFSCAFA